MGTRAADDRYQTMRRGQFALLVAAFGVLSGSACVPGAAAALPTPGPEPSPTQSPFDVQVQLKPAEARLDRDEQVVIQARFTRQRRGVSGAQLAAVVHYPSGDKTFTSEVTTFPDGRVDLAVPVAPAARGTSVKVDVLMTYQGQTFKRSAGFAVR